MWPKYGGQHHLPKRQQPAQQSQKQHKQQQHKSIPKHKLQLGCHQPQHSSQQGRVATLSLQLQQQWAVLLIAFIILQHADVLMCRRIPAATANTAANKRAAHAKEYYGGQRLSAARASTPTGVNGGAGRGVRLVAGDRQLAVNKRSIGGGQPEEIFSVDDRMDTNYDEYPMVVPKRAALLLDRLMVALHHALEDERRKVSDFYAERNDKANIKEDNDINGEDEFDQMTANHMYSDDDPSVIMDYDFKDLNSINRATGETLMGKSFQRRGNMGGLDLDLDMGGGDGVSMLRASTAATVDDDVSALSGIEGGGGVGMRNIIGNTGRMYWRCYFNAVSCF